MKLPSRGDERPGDDGVDGAGSADVVGSGADVVGSGADGASSGADGASSGADGAVSGADGAGSAGEPAVIGDRSGDPFEGACSVWHCSSFGGTLALVGSTCDVVSSYVAAPVLTRALGATRLEASNRLRTRSPVPLEDPSLELLQDSPQRLDASETIVETSTCG